MLVFLRRRHAELQAQRGTLLSRVDSTLTAARSANRDLTTDEERAYDAASDALRAHDAELEEVTRNLREAEQAASRSADANAASVRAGGYSGRGAALVTSQPGTYRRGDVHSPGWVKDLTAVALRGDPDAADRLRRNNAEVADQHRALSTTDGAGGDFVPPLWLVNEFVAKARPGRVTADLCMQHPLPGGTDSINLPRITGGTTTAEQATQNTQVSNTDAVTDTVTAAVTTVAGQQVVSVQFIEQSPVATDEVLLADLVADYAQKVGSFVLNNNAANKRGLLNVSGVISVAFTDADPTVQELYARLADAYQQMLSQRFLPPTAIVMHPRRWAWLLNSRDTANRPLVVPDASQPQNALATATGSVDTSGRVGQVIGLPVHIDPNVPTNLGTNQDAVLMVRFDDVHLYEGLLRAEAFRETKADTLSVLLRVYNYLALHSERYPVSIAKITGTGLTTPAFA